MATLASRRVLSCANLPFLLRHRGALRSATCPSLYRCFGVHAQPPASSSDGDSTKSAAQDVDEENENEKKNRDAKGNGESSAGNPWRHFQVFSGMDEYMDVTLIQYKNNESKSGGVNKDNGEAHKPQAVGTPSSQKTD